jgi:cob(I)alamin adenosyltransferase
MYACEDLNKITRSDKFHKMKIYTLTGDDGSTSFSGGRRVPKHSLRVEAYGSVDELIAWIGLIRVSDSNPERNQLLVYIQDQLMRCAAALASDSTGQEVRKILPDEDCVSLLEKAIDNMDALLPELKKFILPGGSVLVSYCHIARCVCRRAERAVCRLNEHERSPEIVVKFLNRLSDFLFILARKISSDLGNQEVIWTI